QRADGAPAGRGGWHRPRREDRGRRRRRQPGAAASVRGRPGRPAGPRASRRPRARRRPSPRQPDVPQPRGRLHPSHRKGAEGVMTAFLALLRRDLYVTGKNAAFVLTGTLTQPILVVLVFGNILPRLHLVAEQFRTVMLPGLMSISILMAGVQG